MKLSYTLAFIAVVALSFSSFACADDTNTTATPTTTNSASTPSASDFANLPKFTYNLLNETTAIRTNICERNKGYCLTNCGGTNKALKNFCNETTMGWGCGCSDKTPDYVFYEWPINVEDCKNRGVACSTACQSDSTPVDKRADCNVACNKVYSSQCGTSNQIEYDYEVDTATDVPSYSSSNDTNNPSSTTSGPGATSTDANSNENSSANIQNPFIWAISALAIVAAGMMML